MHTCPHIRPALSFAASWRGPTHQRSHVYAAPLLCSLIPACCCYNTPSPSHRRRNPRNLESFPRCEPLLRIALLPRASHCAATQASRTAAECHSRRGDVCRTRSTQSMRRSTLSLPSSCQKHQHSPCSCSSLTILTFEQCPHSRTDRHESRRCLREPLDISDECSTPPLPHNPLPPPLPLAAIAKHVSFARRHCGGKEGRCTVRCRYVRPCSAELHSLPCSHCCQALAAKAR